MTASPNILLRLMPTLKDTQLFVTSITKLHDKANASIMRECIVSEIKQSKYFAVCLDTTADASKQDQLSVIVRYVKEDCGGIFT